MADAQAADATATPTPAPASSTPNASATPAAAPAAAEPAVSTPAADPAAAPVADAAAAVTPSTDWRDGLEGEELDFAKRFTSPKDVAKAALDLRKANSSMIRVPGADAKPEDVEKFRKLLGVPADAAEYKVDLGREITDQDKAVLDPVAKIMHANNVPAKAFAEVSKAVVALAEAQIAEQERVAVSKRGEAEANLRKDWGADFDANLTLAQRARQTFVKDADVLNTVVNGQKLGDHPAIIKAFGEIGRRMGEGDLIGAVGTEERSSLQSRIDQIMRENPVGSEGYKRADVQRELSGLFEKLSGNAPAGAGFGRV